MVTRVTAEAPKASLGNLPLTYEQIVEEIADTLPLPKATAEYRVWMEALELGWNVRIDMEKLGVTPHRLDAQMERLYREGDGFIFETLVFWARPYRQRWVFQALDRIRRHADALGVSPSDVRVLMLGDGTGNDSLFLVHNGLQADYFDIPGGVTYDFAVRRFERRGVLGNGVRVLPAYEDCLTEEYDVVVCFEVLEHVPDPPACIQDIASALRLGGIALVTESFSYCLPHLPTHLRRNLRFAGRTPFLFLSSGLKLDWYSRDPLFRPMQYVKVEGSHPRDFLGLMKDTSVRRAWFGHRVNGLKRVLRGEVGK